MTKTSRAVSTAVASIFPKFAAHRSFIYVRDPVLMIRGFAFDVPPGTCYIWKYYLPLFGSVEFFNMSLGYRVERGYVETKGKSTKEIAAAASEHVRKNDDFSEQESLAELMEFARESRVSSIAEAELMKDLDCFQTEPLEAILARAAANRQRLGIS